MSSRLLILVWGREEVREGWMLVGIVWFHPFVIIVVLQPRRQLVGSGPTSATVGSGLWQRKSFFFLYGVLCQTCSLPHDHSIMAPWVRVCDMVSEYAFAPSCRLDQCPGPFTSHAKQHCKPARSTTIPVYVASLLELTNHSTNKAVGE